MIVCLCLHADDRYVFETGAQVNRQCVMAK